MFKLVDKRVIKWPVTINVPQDGGTTRKAKVTCHYELLTQSELDELLASSTDAEFLSNVVHNVDGIANESGESLEYSDDLASQIYQIVYVRNAILNGYFEALAGGRAKN